jgi:hypothetical protein
MLEEKCKPPILTRRYRSLPARAFARINIAEFRTTRVETAPILRGFREYRQATA